MIALHFTVYIANDNDVSVFFRGDYNKLARKPEWNTIVTQKAEFFAQQIVSSKGIGESIRAASGNAVDCPQGVAIIYPHSTKPRFL